MVPPILKKLSTPATGLGVMSTAGVANTCILYYYFCRYSYYYYHCYYQSCYDNMQGVLGTAGVANTRTPNVAFMLAYASASILLVIGSPPVQYPVRAK
jgi:hypothetical protein